MTDPNKAANEALEAATTRVNDHRSYVGLDSTAVEMAVRLASAHAQMAIARQAEIANLLQARKDFAELPLALSDVNTRLFALLAI